jgi:histidinol-phosphate aminotransferase
MPIKESLKKLNEYKPAKTRPRIKLDANESDNFLFSEPLDLKDVPLNLYPDSNATALVRRLSEIHGVNEENTMVGAGSSELIELVIKTYMNPGDTLLSIEPTFTMYEVYTTIHGGNYVSVPVDDDYQIDMDRLIKKAKDTNPSIIILCSPNNPTGERVGKEAIIRLLKETKSIVLLDEAYIDFSGENASMKNRIGDFDNLIVTRTFSKAYGLAAARLGYLFTNKTIADDLRRVKTPYSVNALSQAIGLEALKWPEKVKAHCENVKKRRESLKDSLRSMDLKVLESDTNFLYVLSDDYGLREKLLEKDIAIRAFPGTTPASYRITVGNTEENQALINALKEATL